MRRRILLLVVGMTTLVVLAFAIPIAILVRNAVAQRAENSIEDQARLIAAALEHGSLSTAQLRVYVAGQIKDTGHPIAVIAPDGTVVGASLPGGVHHEGGGPDGNGGPPHPDPDNEPRPAELHAVAGGQLAVATGDSAAGAYVVAVYLSNSERYEGVGDYYALLIAASAGLLLVAVVAGEVLTRRIARPLVRTAETAQQLAVGDTTARAPTAGPREVADVGKALNRLADRIDQLIADERETVADLSHRLRTPLTTLRLDVEALRDPAEAQRVSAHVGELERRLNAVIHAARRPQREGRMPSCDATSVVREQVEFWSALTDEQGRRSTVTLPAEPLAVRAAAEDLAAAVDALLDNIIAHTPEGSGFSVRLERTEAGARLEIADEGGGIPAAADRRGRSDRGSTGLGLDIARRCAEASGGTMDIGRSPSGGAVVTLHLGVP